LDLTEVQKAMVPGAREALKAGLAMEEARESFILTLVDVALQESGQVQAIAARRLGVNPSLINQALSGKVYSQFRKKKTPEQK
jgi:transcriptional regulator with GAF, ATPase, and Fis domain